MRRSAPWRLRASAQARFGGLLVPLRSHTLVHQCALFLSAQLPGRIGAALLRQVYCGLVWCGVNILARGEGRASCVEYEF